MASDLESLLRAKLGRLTKKQLTEMLLEMNLALSDVPTGLHPTSRADPKIPQSCLRCTELELYNELICDAQDELEVSRAEYFELFDEAPMGYCRLNGSGVVTHANAAAQRMVATGRRLVGQRLSSLMSPDDRFALQRHLRNSPLDGGVCIMECVQFGSPTQSLQVDLVLTREISSNGGSRGVRVVIIDVTRRRAVENDLRMLSEASQNLGASLDYRETVPTVLADICTHRPGLCFVDVSDKKNSLTRLYPHESDAAHPLRRAIDEGYPQHTDASPQVQVFLSGKPLLSADFAIGVSTLRADVSGCPCAVLPLIAHRKVVGCLTLVLGEGEAPYTRAEMQTTFALAERIAMAVSSGQVHRDAQRAVRERQVVLGTVAHDLKNVITAIALRCDLLTQMKDGAAAELGHSILRSTSRMDRMLEDLMDVASIDRGELSLRPIEYNAQALLEEAAESSRAVARARNISLKVEAGGAHVVFCDVDRCLQVLANLLSNAVKFSPPGSQIALCQRQEGTQHVRFAVTDQGPGVASESLPFVFNSFWRAEGQGARGRGLGLTICRGIVEGSGGRIGADSSPGEGSMFHFTMPLAQLPTKPEPLRRDGEILLVDDDDELRGATRAILEGAGYVVAEATNGQEALDMLRHGTNPCLVLLDLNMPVLSGLQFLEERSRSEALKHLNIMVMSGREVCLNHVMERGAEFLLKPIPGDVLLRKVRERLTANNSKAI